MSLEQRLVKVGVGLLESSGPDRLGLREIARQAGVSHGAPRRYFPTHRQLLAAIAQVGLQDLTVLMEAAYSGSTSGREQVLAAAQAYLDFAVHRPEMFRLIFRHDLLEGSGYSLRELSVPLLERLAGVIGEIWSTGDLAGERALLIWTHVHGIANIAASAGLELLGGQRQAGALVEKAVLAQLP